MNFLMPLWPAVTVAVIALCMLGSVYDLLSLPYPYQTIVVKEYPTEYLRIIDNIEIPSVHAARNYASTHSGVRLTILDHANVKRLFESAVVGAESVGVSSDDEHKQLTMLDKYGVVHSARYDPAAGGFTLSGSVINIGPGRPLGFHHLDDNTLVVCDSLKGLLEVDISPRGADSGDGGRVQVLTNEVSRPQQPERHHDALIRYANDLDISANKRAVYFTSSTNHGVVAYDPAGNYYDTMKSFLLTWLSGDVSGRVLRYDYESKRTTVLLDNLFYANGVALSADESFLLVVETVGLRVLKLYLTGEKKGSTEIFIDNLPAFPDGVTRSADGKSFLISLVAPLSPLLPLSKNRYARCLLGWAMAGPLKKLFAPLIKRFGCVMRVDAGTGRATDMYLDEGGTAVATISSAVDDGQGRLFFGNLGGDFVSYFQESP